MAMPSASRPFAPQACRTTFSARRPTPLYRLKTPSHQIGMVRISRSQKGWILPPPSGSQGYRQATITSLSHSRWHARSDHARALASRTLPLPHLQLDELRSRLRSATQVRLSLAGHRSLTKVIPVLHLGPRTQHMAHLVIPSLRQILASGCFPLFTSDGLNLSFYAALGPLWTVAQGGSARAESTKVGRWQRIWSLAR
jgi:hypothetical protein